MPNNVLCSEQESYIDCNVVYHMRNMNLLQLAVKPHDLSVFVPYFESDQTLLLYPILSSILSK